MGQLSYGFPYARPEVSSPDLGSLYKVYHWSFVIAGEASTWIGLVTLKMTKM